MFPVSAVIDCAASERHRATPWRHRPELRVPRRWVVALLVALLVVGSHESPNLWVPKTHVTTVGSAVVTKNC
jgi:hypothetical protein